ncbi:DUF2069 domain-containing protein [Thermomonas fusca]|uniref:DUF2069 domain-containing protein n=1 Tax=Thermomonas fusca TaxID=215690 RepID=A0A5R9PEL4_9GAMM|nr:DUF2069 domain-containing protein [Thermomonas fusca]TLX21030.1 DUF2069 domain-containing protein [Thermomonas fusca]
MNAPRYLAVALGALAALFVGWSATRAEALPGLLVFALPPALLAITALRGWHRAGFTAALLALLWFSHGVMLAWAEPAQRLFALAEAALALLIVHAACLPGMRARRERRQPPE